MSLGLESPFAEWCDRVICLLVEKNAGACDCFSGNTPEEVALAAMRGRARGLVIAARQPSPALRSNLAQSGRRFIAALDDPRAALHNLVIRRDVEWKAAIRNTAGSCATMLSCAALPGALVLRAERTVDRPAAAVAAIAEWLKIEAPAQDIAALLASMPDANALLSGCEWEAWWAGLPECDMRLAEGALGGYIEYFREAEIGMMVWGRELFFTGDAPDLAADFAVDVAGPVRYLLFGPYIALPPGSWDATIAIVASREAANLEYGIEILAGSRFQCLARGKVRPIREGLCELHLQFEISPATDQPIEVRIANTQPAAGGRLALGHIVLVPLVRTPAEIPAEISKALGL